MSKNIKAMRNMSIFSVVLFLAACAQVAPWEKETLARAEMQLDSDPLISALDDHIYFSKEATSGGRSFAGGGCGCN